MPPLPIRTLPLLIANVPEMPVRSPVRCSVPGPNFVNAAAVVTNALDNALFYASSFYTADRAVSDDKLGFRETVLTRVRDRVNEHQLGITVESCEVNVVSPKQVRQAFEQVTVADLERRKSQDDAQGYSSRILSTAQGEASGIVNQGRSDATRLLQQVSAEATYFKDQLASYETSPEFFQARLHAEAMARILTNVQDRVFTLPMSEDERPSEVRIQLNPPPRRRPNPGEAQAPGAAH